MPETTKAGWEIAWKMNPAIGTTPNIVETCSLIHRQARTYARIQERWCNEEMSDRTTARLEEREAQIEARIRALVESLPHADPPDSGNGNGGSWGVKFGGDPRGSTVKIVPPSGWERLADDWGREGICADL